MAQNTVLRGDSLDAQIATFGERAVHEIQRRMDEGIAPALQKETVDRKRASGSATPETPLEDTHRLRDAVTWTRRG
jgi:hypothetical protein